MHNDMFSGEKESCAEVSPQQKGLGLGRLFCEPSDRLVPTNDGFEISCKFD